MALGFNPRCTGEWKGQRPTMRMSVMAIRREHLLKARKVQNLVDKNKKDLDEVDPLSEILLDML